MSLQTLDSMITHETHYNTVDELEEGEIPRFRTPSAFLKLLPEVVVSSLPAEDQSCSICREPYGTGEIPETILILPCKHIFGSACIQHWLSVSNKDTCPCCRTVLFDIDNSDFDADDDDYQIVSELSSFLITGAEHDFMSAFHTVDNLIQTFPTVLSANQAASNREGAIHRARPVLASVQLLELFKEVSRRCFYVPQQYIVRLGSLMGRLAHLLREPLQEMGVVMMWSAYGLPARLLCDPQCQGMIVIAVEKMVDAEVKWVMGGVWVGAAIEGFGLERRADDRL